MSWENERWNRTGANWEEEEDVAELARYHALNNDKDEMLYRDNPDYREAYDSIKENTMKISKRQLKRIIREEKQKVMTESVDLQDPQVRELIMNLLDAMQKSGVSPYYWERMLDSMQSMGGDKALWVFESALTAYENNEDPNDYA